MNRVSTNAALFAIAAIVAFAAFSVTASAQLGEVAGPLNYTIGLGGTMTLNMTIFNSGTEPIPYKVIPPFFKTTIANTTKPTVTATPSSGMLQPKQSQKVEVTVSIPTKGNKPGYIWSGIIQVLQVSNSTQQGVALIQGGVAKGVNVTAAAQTFNILEVIVPAAVVIIAIVVAVVLWKKGIIGGAKAKRPAAAAAAKAGARKASTRKGAARRRSAKRRSTARKTTRRRASTRARRRRR